MYHFPYWQDYISDLHFDPKETVHLQNVIYSEMKQMFLKKVDQIIFAEHEMNHFNHFCIEYRQIARNC